MADSNITKHALATALKELMEENPFNKISVANICEKCCMNRKSFYYHFKDKYDLVNWIYDMEFITIVRKKGHITGWEYLEELTAYFYNNRYFYRKVLSVEGQNSFGNHFREMMIPVVVTRMREILPMEEMQEFQINFFTDAVVETVYRWIMGKNCMSSEEFMVQLKKCIQSVVKYVDI